MVTQDILLFGLAIAGGCIAFYSGRLFEKKHISHVLTRCAHQPYHLSSHATNELYKSNREILLSFKKFYLSFKKVGVR